MDRWTERFNSDGEKAIAIHDGSDFPDVCFEGEREYDVMNALAEYEDLEEQGLLLRLPCKVGDIIWDNDFGYPESYEIKAFSYGYCDSYVEPDIEDQITFYYENYSGSIAGAFPMSEIGKTVFLTREEAGGDEEE